MVICFTICYCICIDIIGLFSKTDRITAPDVARALGLSARMEWVLLAGWIGDGWLVVADPSRRKRSYKLTAIYMQRNKSNQERQSREV